MDDHDHHDEPVPSPPATVPDGFVRTATLRTKGGWRRALPSNASEEDRRADRIEAARKARLLDARLRAWLAAATAAHAERPEEFDARSTTADTWARFVNVIEITHRGRVVLKVPNLHGWPIAGAADRDGIDAGSVGPVLNALSAMAREPEGTTFSTDVEKAGPLLGALLRTSRRDVHDLYCDAEDRCWLLVEVEQEDGLATCVVDPSDSVVGDEAYAWHPPASASDAVPLRLSCEWQGGTWRIDSRRWKDHVVPVRPPVMDPMETLRLCAPHAE